MSFLPLSRRGLLRTTAAGCAAVASASLLPACGYDVDPATSIEVAADAKGLITLPLSQAAMLSAVGGAAILSQSSAGTGIALPVGGILVVRYDQATFVAVAALCTHQGCALGYSSTERLIACPCHGSRFLAQPASGKCIGEVSRGPAVSAVRSFATTFDSATSTLSIDLTRTPTCGTIDIFIPSVVDGQVVLPLDKVPELASPGGSYTTQPQGLPDTLIVIRVDATSVVALSAVCTHQGCLVEYATSGMDLECPCHASRFDLTGAVTMSPAPSPLKKYVAAVDSQSVTITIS
jgi:Rieske Fe-S protein